MDDIVFIHNEKEYEDFRKQFGNTRIKVKFICSICKKESIKRFASLTTNFCCKTCNWKKNREKITEKKKQTCLKRYGTVCPLQNEKVAEKTKKTNLQKYGAENFTNREKCGKTKLEKYGTIGFNNHKKAKQTKLEKYGNENFTNHEKAKQTCLEKYGTEEVLSNLEIREKIKQSCLEKYDCENPFQVEEVKERIKQTNFERYGVEHPMQSKEIQEKANKTCLERYAVNNPFELKTVKEKIKQDNLEKYGVEYYTQTDDYKTKTKQTCLAKYGVPSYSQTLEFAQKSRKKYPYDGLAFDSQDELRIYKYCKQAGLKVKYQPCSFKYTDSLKRTHTYFPDFEIEGQLYEVKGNHLWKDDHVWFPYRNTLSEQELKEIDARDLAKTECMKVNKVKVILSDKVNDFLEKCNELT